MQRDVSECTDILKRPDRVVNVMLDRAKPEVASFCFAQSTSHLFHSFRLASVLILDSQLWTSAVLYPFESIDPSDKMPTFRYVDTIKDILL